MLNSWQLQDNVDDLMRGQTLWTVGIQGGHTAQVAKVRLRLGCIDRV